MPHKLTTKERFRLERDPKYIAQKQVEWEKRQERIIIVSSVIIVLTGIALIFALVRYYEVMGCVNGSIDHFVSAQCDKVIN